MQKIIYVLVTILIVAGLGFALGYFVSPTPIVQNVGITTKSDLTTSGALTVGGESQMQRVVQGGDVTNASSTLTSALTLTAAQICDSSVITVNNSAVAGTIAAASLDITTAATSTLFADCLDTDGDSVSFWLMNNSPTAASTTEMVAGSGCDLRISEDTGADDTLAGLEGARVTVTRATDVLGNGGSADCLVMVEKNKVD